MIISADGSATIGNQIGIEPVGGGLKVVHISPPLEGPSGGPGSRAGAGTRAWTGRVPQTGVYRIEVVRQPTSGTETLLYTLAVALK